MKHLYIGSRRIGPGEPTLVIAEIGVNHDGSVERALELVDAAAGAGADGVKLQIFKAQTLLHPSAGFAAYQKSRCPQSDPTEMLARYELSDADLNRIVAAIRQRGLIPLATPFSVPDVARIARLDLPAIKIASPDLVNRPLLQCAAALGKPLLISTGAATMEEVETTVRWLRQWNARFALLHCISAYPVAPEDAHLCWITELSQRFDVPVGYSDHTTQLFSGAAAVLLGACILEKHLTYDGQAPGPDHAASADPGQFSQYVQFARTVQQLHGTLGKRVLEIEQDVRTVSRQSLVLSRAVKSGQPLQREDLIVQRPGTGISAADYDKAIGRKALANLPAGTLLQWGMFSEA